METPDSTPDTASVPPALPPSMPTPPPSPPPPAPQPCKSGFFSGCLMALGVIFLVMMVGGIVLSIVFAGLVAKGFKEGLSSSETSDATYSAQASGLKEVWSSDYLLSDDDDEGPAKAVCIPLVGTIDLAEDSPDFFGSKCTSATTLRAIRHATEDMSVEAILLEVDSPGGGITASDILYHELMKFKESDPARRIVVLMGDMAASGGYYASLPADRIVAHPTTITGSIGVILSSVNVHQLTDKLGIVDESVTSGPNKAILNPMREVTDEQRALLQGTVDELYDRFAGLVSEHRKIPMEDVRAIADGRIYTAKQALALRLVDVIGYEEDAKQAIYELLGSPKGGVEFYEYERKSSLRDIFSSPDFWGKAMSRALPAADAASQPRPQLR